MAIERDGAASKRLEGSLLKGGDEVYPFLRADLPEGWSTEPDKSPLWTTPIQRCGLSRPCSYELVVAKPDHFSLPPFYVFPQDGTGNGKAAPEELEAYCKGSVDLTMRGGTTSGVVYPLAVCEIARERRIRNVGGASAGAIAASAAAAAELGRMTLSRQPSDEGLPGDPAAPSATDRSGTEGRFSPGFAGLAQSLGWLLHIPNSRDGETPAGEPGPYKYRLAQLFRPTPRTRPLFRLVVAAMRHRWWALPALAVTAFGPWSAALVLLLLLAAPLLVTWLALDFAGDLGTSAELYAWAALGLAAVTLTLVSAVFLSASIPRRGTQPPRGLAEPLPPPAAVTSRQGGRFKALLRLLITPVLLLAGLAALGLAVRGLSQGNGNYGRLLLLVLGVWLPLIAGVLAVLAGGVYGIVRQAKRGKFGLVSGATTSDQLWPAGWRGWAGRIRDQIAGMPPRTEKRALVPWLSDTLNDLAGLPDGTVLRFGHLWVGAGFTPGPSDDQIKRRLAGAAKDARQRRVNLELITSELVQGVPYRFPLPPGSLPRLYLRKSDLNAEGEEVFPPEVIEALTPGEPLGANGQKPKSAADGEEIADLYPLPDPWDLPVVFATRLSLSLPGLFQAVRLYAARPYQHVHEDFGLGLQEKREEEKGEDFIYPWRTPSGAPSPGPGGGDVWLDELWFSDGGITSNFPIHFFDAVLPAWPTLGINLGPHPAGFGWQDVWLPQDWQAQAPLPTPMAGSMLGFLGAIVNTARGWHDTLQTFMPGFRSRVAWVRQGQDEGGSNLFMPADTIASLALRGQFAGARLRRRFTNDSHWQRHQWIRLRIALDNLSSLHRDVANAAVLPLYPDLLHAGSAPGTLKNLKAALARHGDPWFPDLPGDWYEPEDDEEKKEDRFWDAVQALATAFNQIGGQNNSLSEGVPEPAPELKQSPPI